MHDENNAVYLVLPKYCIRITVRFYLRDHPPTTNTLKPKLNGPILNICQTINNVVDSAAEAETGGLFLNGHQTNPHFHEQTETIKW